MARNEIGTAKDILNVVKASQKTRIKTSLNVDPEVWAEFKKVVKEKDLFLSDVLEEILIRFCKGL